MARKPLIPPGSVLPPAPEAADGGGVLGRIIANDRERSGRAAPSPPAPPDSDGDVGTRPITQVSNEISKPASKAVSNQVSQHVPAQTRASSVPDTAPDAAEAPARPAARRSAARSLGQEDREAVIRLSIDVPQSLYDRIKRYVLEHRIESTRALTLALYQDFLDEEGY